jgi:hypothetical protein
MKTMRLTLLGIATIFLASCNSGSSKKENNDVIIKPAQIEIKGDLKGCYEVVDKNYKLVLEKSVFRELILNVELMRTEAELPYDRKDVVIFPEADKSQASYCAGFGLEILDKDGSVIEKETAKHTPYSWDEFTELLQILPGETATVQFHIYSDIDHKEATEFRITSIVEKNTNSNSTPTTEKDDDDNEEEENVSNDEYDKVLDDIEKKIADLKEKSEKIGKGVGLLEVQGLQLKITEEMEKINQNKLSAKQQERYQNLLMDLSMATLSSAGNTLDALF